MVQATVTIKNKTGLHARPASQLITLTKKFKCDVFMVKDEQTGNAKSILNILTMNLKQDSEVLIRAEGEDEEEALSAVVEFISNLTE